MWSPEAVFDLFVSAVRAFFRRQGRITKVGYSVIADSVHTHGVCGASSNLFVLNFSTDTLEYKTSGYMWLRFAE